MDHENTLVKRIHERSWTIKTTKNYNEDQKEVILLLSVNDDEACNLELRVIVDAGKWIFTNRMASVEYVDHSVYVSI